MDKSVPFYINTVLIPYIVLRFGLALLPNKLPPTHDSLDFPLFFAHDSVLAVLEELPWELVHLQSKWSQPHSSGRGHLGTEQSPTKGAWLPCNPALVGVLGFWFS